MGKKRSHSREGFCKEEAIVREGFVYLIEGSKKGNGILEVKWESWYQNLRYFLSVLFLLFSVAYFLSIFYVHTIGHHAVHMMICYSIQIIFYMFFYFYLEIWG